MSRTTKIPSIRRSKNVPREVSNILEAVKQLLETREGLRGNPLDRFVTLRELSSPSETTVTVVSATGGSGTAEDETFSFFMG